MTTTVEIRRALYGTRKVVLVDGARRTIEVGVGPDRAREIALRWGRIMGCDVVDRSDEILDDAELARTGKDRVEKRG